MKKYTLRKIGKKLLPIAFIGIVTTLTNNTAQAQENEVLPKSEEETKEVELKATKENVDNVKIELDTVNSEVNKQEEVTDKAKTELDNATKNVAEKEKAVSEAEKLNAEATDENKDKVREDITTKEEAQATKQQEVDNKKQEKTEKEVEITNQTLELEKATNNVENKETEKAESKKEVEKAQAILDGTNSKQIIEALEKATKQVEQDQKDLAVANTELEKAKESDRQRAEAITQATTEKEQAQEEANRTKEELKEATENKEQTATTLANAKTELDKAQADFNGINTITLTKEYIENLKKAFDFSLTKEERANAEAELKRVNAEVKALNKYKVNTNDNNTTLLDVNNLSVEVRKELSLLANDLVNQIREQMGTEKTTVTSSAMNFADKVAKGYADDNWSIWVQFAHNDEKIKAVAGEYGLPQGQYYENLAGVLGTNQLTYSKLKESVYNAIVGFMLNGKEYLHAQSVAGINWGTPKEQYLALDLSNVGGKNQLHLITVDN